MGQGSSDDDTDDNVSSQARNSLPTPPQSPIWVSGSPLRAHCNHGDPFLDSSVRSRRAEKGHDLLEDGSLSSLETLRFEIPSDLIQSSLSNGSPASENHPWRRRSHSRYFSGAQATPKDRSVHEYFKSGLHDDIARHGNATPALTPDNSPERGSCLATPISVSYGRGDLDGEFEEAEKGNVEGTASSEIFKEAPRTPPMPVFLSALNKRLRPSQRPLRDHQFAQSPTRTPDRFISGRSVTMNPHQQLKLGKITSKLSGTERSLRRRTGRSDPFRLQPQSRAISTNNVVEDPLGSLHASRVRAEFGSRPGSAAAPGGLHQITPSSVWHVGGPSIAAGRQPVSSADLDIMPISRPNAPVYTSRFINSIKSDKGRSLHEKRLALALGIDPLNKILDHGPDIVNRFGDTTFFGPRFGVRHAAATKAFHDAGYGAMTWENNAWIKRGSLRSRVPSPNEKLSRRLHSDTSVHPVVPLPLTLSTVLEAPNLRDDFYCSVLAYSATADRLAVGLADKLYLWSEETGVVNPPREVEPRFSRLTYITSLAFSSAQGGRAILAIGRANGCISMYSPLEDDSHFMDISMVTAAAHLCFSPKPVRRPSARHVAVLTEQEVLLVGDDAGILLVYLVEWPSISQRDLFGWPGATTLHCKIAVHTQQICGIGWSPDGTYFATGGNDNLCALFDSRKILAPPPGVAIFRAEAARHRWRLAAAVKAIAFCPWQRGLLAAGGGSNDRGIHFYHTMSGAALAVIDCAAQVTSLIWSTTRREIVATFGFAQPEHPYRIVVYAWPSCRQVVAIPWQEEMRALFAIAYPGGPNGARGRRTVQQQRRRQEDENERTQGASASGSTTTGPSLPRTLGRGRVSRRIGAVAEGASGARRTREEGCIVVAGSDGSIKFHEVWADDENDAAPPRDRHGVGGGLSVLARHGLLGGSDILEGLHGIEREEAEVIR